MVYVNVIYCPLVGEPRVFPVEVELHAPVGVLGVRSYDYLDIPKRSELHHFKVEIALIPHCCVADEITQLPDFEYVTGNKQKLRARLLETLSQIIETPLIPTSTLNRLWPDGLPAEVIHVAVIENDLLTRISSIGALPEELRSRYPALQGPMFFSAHLFHN
ncbi:hypothetical protein B0H12DRAFT_809782 [Mycena haematopus]|nr:hypothetical protein B0H12DRAFT_809782 [Mycena haematopus]